MDVFAGVPELAMILALFTAIVATLLLPAIRGIRR